MLQYLENKLIALGVSNQLGHELSVATVIVAILIVAVAANLITKRLLVSTIRRLVRHTRTSWDDALIEQGVFRRLARVVPALIISALATVPFPKSPEIVFWIKQASIAYMILVGLLVLDAIIDAALSIYQRTELSRQRPLKSYSQVLKIILFVFGSIMIIATLLNRSALGILGGLGAMTAIIILVFKDSILGFVAGVQLAANDMVRKGDWIEMKKFGADGEIIDISLTTIKIQNWDKTITMVPTYSLVADSLKNWRGMSDAGKRRIKRSLYIDMNSIRLCTATEIEHFETIENLSEYIKAKKAAIAEYNQTHQINTENPVNGRRLTNVGTYRAYIAKYLQNHPKIDNDMTLIVRHLSPDVFGLPIEIYCFCTDTRWAYYEDVQADIFDHLIAITDEFGLRIFQNPSGADFTRVLRAPIETENYGT